MKVINVTVLTIIASFLFLGSFAAYIGEGQREDAEKFNYGSLTQSQPATSNPPLR
jgi:hypothetical protein